MSNRAGADLVRVVSLSEMSLASMRENGWQLARVVLDGDSWNGRRLEIFQSVGLGACREHVAGLLWM